MCLIASMRTSKTAYDKLSKNAVNGEVAVYKILSKEGMHGPFVNAYRYKPGENVSNSRMKVFTENPKRKRNFRVYRGLHVFLDYRGVREYKKRVLMKPEMRKYKIFKLYAKLSDFVAANQDGHAVFTKLELRKA